MQIEIRTGFLHPDINLLNCFLSWCKNVGIVISNQVKVDYARPQTIDEAGHICAQYGMIAIENIIKGTVIFTIPRKSIFTWENSSIANLIAKGFCM